MSTVLVQRKVWCHDSVLTVHVQHGAMVDHAPCYYLETCYCWIYMLTSSNGVSKLGLTEHDWLQPGSQTSQVSVPFWDQQQLVN
jgi:hypothetical protein